jgi:hypothetical protein
VALAFLPGATTHSRQSIKTGIISQNQAEAPMLLIREVFYCKPGKVRPMVDKFLKMSDINEKAGLGKMRIMTDFAGERYWTVTCEFEVASMAALEEMMSGKGMTEDLTKQLEAIFTDYHDLIDHGRREIYKIEGT